MEHHTVNRTGARHAFAAVIDHRKLTRLCVEALHRIFGNAYTDRDEGAEAAMASAAISVFSRFVFS
jgi:hypothetical protein